MNRIKTIAVVLLILIQISCSKDNASNNEPIPEVLVINSTKTALLDFKYKIFYQEATTTTNRKGLVILAHGDGGTENDALLNDQCADLARLGYVAITTSYKLPGTGYVANVNAFKNCMEEVIKKNNTDFAIPANNTIVGGLSLGGNLAYFMFLPAANDASPSTINLKGAALMCAGADSYRGSAILKPAIMMSNKIDSQVGITNAYDFKTALLTNPNPNVSTLSDCLIFDNNNVNAHCTNASEYKAFLIKKVKEWLP